MADAVSDIGAKAQVDFHCLDDECQNVISFNLAEVIQKDFQAVCKKCHKTYSFDAQLQDKLIRMLQLVAAVRNAEDILGDSNVSVNVAGGSVKIPYALLHKITARITHEVEGINRVLYDLTPKPTGTIEWE